IEKNPLLCKSCHGMEPKPLWSPFPFWPGVLGEGPLLTKEEEERLAAFTRDNEEHPRYKHLYRAANFEWARNSGMSPAWTLQESLEKPLARQLARQLAASPSFPEDRFALVASLILCDD